MGREDVQAKARRYLVEGRLLVNRVDGTGIGATCRGGDVYDLGRDSDGWWCSCPARGACAHLAALQLVTPRDASAGEATTTETTTAPVSGASDTTTHGGVE